MKEIQLKKRYLLPMSALLLAGFVYPITSEPVALSGPASFVAPKDKALVVFVRDHLASMRLVVRGSPDLTSFRWGTRRVRGEKGPHGHRVNPDNLARLASTSAPK